jgi:hypothetical protein
MYFGLQPSWSAEVANAANNSKHKFQCQNAGGSLIAISRTKQVAAMIRRVGHGLRVEGLWLGGL